MSTTLRIPAPLRAYTDDASTVSVTGNTVDEAIRSLTDRYPELHPHLFDDGGKLRSFVNVYRNDEDVRHLDRGATVLREGDELVIVPSIAGGLR